MKTGVKTKAVVKNLIEVHDEDGTMYKPVFEFLDKSNISREFVSSVSSRPAAYKIGEKVKVVYNPKDYKEVKVVSYWGLYRWSIILCCITIFQHTVLEKLECQWVQKEEKLDTEI